MHLFFDSTLNTWKLITEKLPEKPNVCDHCNDDPDHTCCMEHHKAMKAYNAAIAAIKQNALTVVNDEIVKEKLDSLKWVGRIEKADVYEWPGGYETKEIEKFVQHKYCNQLTLITVAILTLPEEKKNTMEKEIFAKIIELRGYQIVVMKDFEPEDDNDIDVLVMVTYSNGVQIQMKAGFKTSKARDKAFNNYGEKEAHEFIKSVEQLTK